VVKAERQHVVHATSSRVLDFKRALMAEYLVVRLMILQSSLKYNVKLRIHQVNGPIVVVGIGGAGLGNRQLGTRFELRTELPRARRRLCTQTRSPYPSGGSWKTER
jgi:hypothetical protein